MAETSPGTPASADRQESLSRSEDRIAAGEGVAADGAEATAGR